MFRRVLAFFLSFVIVFATSSAQAASGWTVDKATSSGSRVIIGATNNGFKSAINVAPNAVKIAKMLAKRANAVSLGIAIAGMFNDGLDWVLDPANNSVRVKTKASYEEMAIQFCKDLAARQGRGYYGIAYNKSYPDHIYCAHANGKAGWAWITEYDMNLRGVGEVVPLSSVSESVADKAEKGDAASQKILRDVATAAVIAGDYDDSLMAGAVPVNDYTKPVVPVVPPAQVGDLDSLVTGGDVGAAAESARQAADEARKAAQAAKDAATKAQEEAIAAADRAKDLINQAVDQAIRDAAIEAAKEADRAAQAAKDVADAAANKAAEAANAAADKAIAAKGEAQKKLADAISEMNKALESGNADRIKKAEEALTKAKEEASAADKAAEKAKEKADEAAKDKPKEKPFELPAFCSWAKPVCDAVDWLMKPNEVDETIVDIESEEVAPTSTDINFGGSCPADFNVKAVIFGNNIDITLLDMSKFCNFLQTFVKYPVYAMSSLWAIYIVGGRKDG